MTKEMLLLDIRKVIDILNTYGIEKELKQLEINK